ncbi:Ribosomal RNA large subunit methyltransferase H [Azospirillaceae bacterium]
MCLAAVGRLRAGPERSLFELYAQRLTWPLTVREVEIKKTLTVSERRRREAELLSEALPSGAVILALDERGQQLDSGRFAARLGRWRDDGVQDLGIVIGGADGLDESIRNRAGLVLAFGAMTWPHMLVRVLVAEQIYRAQQILAGHPYHRDG